MNLTRILPGRDNLFAAHESDSFVVKPSPYSRVQYRFQVVVGRNSRKTIFVLSKDEVTAKRVAKDVTGLPVIAIQLYRPEEDHWTKEFVRQVN